MSLYEIKTPQPFDASVLDKMLVLAKNALKGVEKQQYTQAVVFVTSKGNEYCSVIVNAISETKADEKELLGKLHSAEDTEVHYILCMWHNGDIDIPSYELRKMLIQLNHENNNARSFVRSKDGYSVIKLEITM